MSGGPFERRPCADCAAWMQRWRGWQWRCPWTRDTDTIPDTGDWYCTRPFARRMGPDQVSVIQAARPGITTTV